MSDPAIIVENLSKRYRIGLREERSKTFSGAVNNFLRAPFANYKKLRALKKFNEEEGRDVIWALKDVSFEIKEGEVVGIIGRNGAGKSTLLKILSRITEPTTGRITIYGRVASLLEVGTGFNPELSGRENIFLNGTILGMTRREINKKLEEIIDFSGVEKFIDTPVKRYSSGMYVRLAFAVAAHIEPEILVIDEVLAVGDVEFQKKCMGKMNEISQRKGGTVLFVSHNMQFVQNLCSRGLLMDDGRITYGGEVSNVVNRYFSSNNTNGSTGKSQLNGFSISDFKIKDDTGVETEVLRTGNTYDINCEIHGSVSADFPFLIFSITTPFGEKIVNLSSRLAGITISNFEKVLQCQINLKNVMIMPGLYYINIYLLDSRGYSIAMWENFKSIEVLFGAEMVNISLPSQQSRGYLYIPSKWNITSE